MLCAIDFNNFFVVATIILLFSHGMLIYIISTFLFPTAQVLCQTICYERTLYIYRRRTNRIDDKFDCLNAKTHKRLHVLMQFCLDDYFAFCINTANVSIGNITLYVLVKKMFASCSEL